MYFTKKQNEPCTGLFSFFKDITQHLLYLFSYDHDVTKMFVFHMFCTLIYLCMPNFANALLIYKRKSKPVKSK